MSILKVERLSKYFPVRSGIFLFESSHVKAVDDVSFTMEAGKTVGLVGESGCGKSTLGRTIVRLLKPTAGDVFYNDINLNTLSNRKFNNLRKEIQIIFQDPYSSLDPKQTVYQIISEPLQVHHYKGNKKDRVRELMNEVGLNPSHLSRYPHEFSGGQRQRISIARAIALTPKLIIADEAVSALDVSIQAQILNLLKDLQEKYNLSILFISHDLSVIRHMSDTVIVMYLGKIVEIASRDELFNNPVHPYTKALLDAIPSLEENSDRKVLGGEVPSPIDPPSGCTFHPRCPSASEECKSRIADISDWSDGDHKAACYRIANG
jgi:oligopeptide/dipeptide ABC transporter ATP-binding protein